MALSAYSWVRGLFYRVFRRPIEFEGLAEMGKELREKGFLVIKDYYSDAEIADILHVVEEHMHEDMGDYDHINRVTYYRRPLSDQKWDGGVYRMFAAHALHPSILKFRHDPKLRQIIETGFRTKLTSEATVIQKNLPVGTETRGFHVDMYAPREFKAFLFLTDVFSESNGPYAILRGSHRWQAKLLCNYLKRGVLHLDPVTTVGELNEKELACLEKFWVRKGTVVLSIQQAIHRGWPHTQGRRLAVVNYYLEKFSNSTPDFNEENRLGYRYN